MKLTFHIFRKHYAPALVVGALVSILSIGCSTGIESTKRIELSKEDRKQTAVTPEDTFLCKVQAQPHDEWSIGKRFVATDDRTALIFDANQLASEVERMALAGKELQFRGTTSQMMPNGDKAIVLLFSDGSHTLSYNTRKPQGNAIHSTEIPMMIDLDIVSQVRQKLVGLNLWTRSSLWYNASGEKTDGQKYVPVTITDVTFGDKVFPIKVLFTDSDGSLHMMLMNVTDSGIDSRSFANLFYLSDPRPKYPHIDDEVWQLIQNGQVRNGMTKEECRLSLGSPKEVNKGHNYSSTLELWQYTDGVYLQFQDDLLVNFRR